MNRKPNETGVVPISSGYTPGFGGAAKSGAKPSFCNCWFIFLGICVISACSTRWPKVDADEDGIGGDDAADALRYLVATKAREIKARKLRWL